MPLPEWVRHEMDRRAKENGSRPLPEWLKQELANRAKQAQQRHRWT